MINQTMTTIAKINSFENKAKELYNNMYDSFDKTNKAHINAWNKCRKLAANETFNCNL